MTIRVWDGAEELEPMLVSVHELVPDPKNTKRHDARSIASIKASLRDYGQQKNVVTYGGIVIAGNGTLEAAKQLGWTHLAVAPFTGTAEEAKAYAIADNRTAEKSEWNEPALLETLQDWAAVDEASVRDLGFEESDLVAMAGRVLAWASGGSEGGGGTAETADVEPPRLGYTVLFDTAAEKALWDGFLRTLQSLYPEHETTTDRLVAHIRDVLMTDSH